MEKCKCKTRGTKTGKADRSDVPVRHREMGNPSVYAKRSFPWSIVNTRQTPGRVEWRVGTTFAEEELWRIERRLCHRWAVGTGPTSPKCDESHPRSVRPYLHCGPPNAVPTSHRQPSDRPRMVNVRNVVRVTECHAPMRERQQISQAICIRSPCSTWNVVISRIKMSISYRNLKCPHYPICQVFCAQIRRSRSLAVPRKTHHDQSGRNKQSSGTWDAWDPGLCNVQAHTRFSNKQYF